MKTLKISDKVHAKLTSVVGKLMAETGKMKTYSDTVEVMLSNCVMLPPELLDAVDSFIKDNEQLEKRERANSQEKDSACNGSTTL